MVEQSTSGTSNWNVPNVLTVIRILLVPLFGWLLLTRGDSDSLGGDASMRIWAAIVFAIAIATDKLDGDIARARGIVTDFGKLMDPIADKALTGMAFIGLSIIGDLWWWVTVLILGREWAITFLRLWVRKYGVVPASQGGKIKTTLQALAIEGLVLPFLMLDGSWETVGVVLWWIAVVLMAAALVFTIVTGVQYVGQILQVRRDGMAGEDAARGDAREA